MEEGNIGVYISLLFAVVIIVKASALETCICSPARLKPGKRWGEGKPNSYQKDH
jgi:hypothetical protein